MKVDYKIRKAVSSLGFNYLDIANLLEMSEKVPLVSWGVNKKTGVGKIFLNPKVAKFPVEQIKLLIRREVLHYAGYQELGTEGLRNRELSNFTLDIAINRILALAYQEEMNKLCKKIYPKGSEKSPMALAQSHLDYSVIDPEWDTGDKENKIADMHTEIWGSSEIPSPLSLYFRLLNQKFDQKQNPFRSPEGDSEQEGEGSGQDEEGSGQGGKGSGQRRKGKGKPSKGKSSGKPGDKPDEEPSDKPDEEPSDKPDEKLGDGTVEISYHEIPKGLGNAENKDLLGQLGKQIESIEDDVEKDPDAKMTGGGFSTLASNFFQKTIAKVKGGLDIRGVTRFIDQLNLTKEMTNVLDPLIREASSTSRRQLYPYRLSRLGTIYIACGISEVIPFFWNRTLETQKLSVSVYVDTSPSMDYCIEKEIQLIDRLKDSFPSKIFAFSGSVKEASIRQFAEGTYFRGSSTCFNAVVMHFLEQKEEFALVFTDGKSGVAFGLQAKFRKSKKRLFAIYFNDNRDYTKNVTSDLDKIAERTTTLHVG